LALANLLVICEERGFDLVIRENDEKIDEKEEGKRKRKIKR
jgi:hypothetical protein